MGSRLAIARATKAMPGGARPTAGPQTPNAPYYGNYSPLSQQIMGSDQSWSAPYNNFLPRPPASFTQGAFGPMSPILPVPVDMPPEGAERAEARRFEYEPGYNLPTGQPGSEGFKLVPFSALKSFSELYSVARACIQYRKSEIRGLDWDIVPTSAATKAYQGDHDAMRDFGERVAKAKKFFRHPDPDFLSFSSWLDAILDQIFVYDALTLLIRPTWAKGMGKGVLGSDLDSLQLINGPTIRPLLDLHGATPRPPAPAYQQYLFGVPRSDFMDMITLRDIEEAGLEEYALGQYRGDQMLYLPFVKRIESPYGFPPIERALVPIMSGLQKQAFQLDYFREGCYSADTEILTKNGWKLFADLNSNDEVATRSENGSFEWQLPSAHLEYDFDGDMIEFSNRYIDLLVTPGHRMLVRRPEAYLRKQVSQDWGDWHIRIAKYFAENPKSAWEIPVSFTGWDGYGPAEFTLDPLECNRQEYLDIQAARWLNDYLADGPVKVTEIKSAARKQNISNRSLHSARQILAAPLTRVKGVRGGPYMWGSPSCSVPELPVLQYNYEPGVRMGMKEFCAFLGIFLAEGSVSDRSLGGTRRDVVIQIAQSSKSRHLLEINQILANTGMNWNYDAKNGRFYATSARLGRWLKDNCGHGSSNKRIPVWVKNLPSECLDSLLRGMMIGDGNWRSLGQRWYSTSSEALANDVQEIFTKLGSDASIQIYHVEKYGKANWPQYRVAERLEGRGAHLLPPAQKRPYKGKVYCVTVPNGVVYVRRNISKKAAICGNTVPAVYISPGDPNITPNQIAELQDALNAFAGDPAWKHKIIVLPPGSRVDPQKPGDIADQFDQIVMTQVLMAFDVQPMELGIIPQISTTASASAVREMAMSQRSVHERVSTKPTLKFLTDIFDVILHRYLGQDDMHFTFEGLQQEAQANQLTDMLVRQVQYGIRSVDEARDELELPPWGLPETSGPVVFTGAGPMPFGPIGQPGMPGQPGQPGQPGPAAEMLPSGAPGGQASPTAGTQAPVPGGQTAAAASARAAMNASRPGPAPGQVPPSLTPGHAAAEAELKEPSTAPTRTGREQSPRNRTRAADPDLTKSDLLPLAQVEHPKWRHELMVAKAEAARVTEQPPDMTRAVHAELEALVRHLKKGRDHKTWQVKHIPDYVPSVVANQLALGEDPALVKETVRDMIILDHSDYQWAA